MTIKASDKTVSQEGITYSINELEKTASVIKCRSNKTEITLPVSIRHESEEYTLTSIASQAFQCSKVRLITFAPNSKLRTIEKDAFAFLYLTRITIPASVVELEEGWCRETRKLKQIEVEKGNARYMSIESKYIIGKSDISNEDYDTLIICARGAVEFTIPENIKIIGPHAFSYSNLKRISIPAHVTQICERAFSSCRQLVEVEFQTNSELRTIGPYAFSQSNLNSVTIPAHISQICKGAFYYCIKLVQIEFQPNSELQIIENDAFACSNFTRITIPARVVELEEGWCRGTKNLKQIEVEKGNARYLSIEGKCIIGKSDISNEDYDTLIICARDAVEFTIPENIKIIGPHAFSYSNLERISIPAHVTRICESAFNQCKKLAQVEFHPNSELKTIEKDAFAYSKIQSISIPAHVIRICESAFNQCEQLAQVEFHPNSELQAIEKGAFSLSKLDKITIPASTIELNDGWCFATLYLKHVEVESGNPRYLSVEGKYIIGKSDINSENYDTLIICARNISEFKIPGTIKIIGPHAFSHSKLKNISIPAHVMQICEFAFYHCEQLVRIEFLLNSELRAIEKFAFAFSKLESISIPLHVTQICERAFYQCSKLIRVEFEPNSELQNIGPYALSYSKFPSISIPSHIEQISEDAFYSCKQLQMIEFDENSVSESISKFLFVVQNPNIMIPVQKKHILI